MYRRGVKQVVGILIVLVLAMLARGVSANGSKNSATIEVLNAASLNGKELKPGTYTITADDTKVTVAQNGKVMAEAPVEWKDETNKPRNSNIVTNNNEVTEIHFSGKMRYVTIAPVEGKL